MAYPSPVPAAERGDVYQTIGKLDLFRQAYGALRSGLPGFQHSIQCTVVGGPDTNIRRLWYLCVAVVYGRFRNRVRTEYAPVASDSTWDITGKAVSMELNYHMNALNGLSTDRPEAAYSDPGENAPAFLARGPEQLTVGGGWDTVFNPLVSRVHRDRPTGDPTRANWLASPTGMERGFGFFREAAVFTMRVVGEQGDGGLGGIKQIDVLNELPVGGFQTFRGTFVTLAASKLVVRAYPMRVQFPDRGLGFPGATVSTPGATLPYLPDEGRVITTNEKNDPRVQPTKPHIDGSSRSSLLALVSAALQQPCYLPLHPPDTKNFQRGGMYVLPKGASSTADPIDVSKLWAARGTMKGVWPLDNNAGPDGYPLPGAGAGDTTVPDYAD